MKDVIYRDNLYIVDIEADTPRKRGLIHGESLRGAIAVGLDRWKTSIEKLGLDPEKMISHFIEETSFMTAVEKWTPGLLEEVRGIADGAGQDFETVYAYQLMDDFFGYLLKNLPGPHCTSIGLSGNSGSPAIISQNQDMPGCYNGTQTVLRIHYKESGLKVLVFTLAGNIGQNVANNKGIGLAINTLGFLEASASGLPSMFIVRAIGEKTSLADAEKFLRTVEHSAGMNYMIGCGSDIKDFESSANTVTEYEYPCTGNFICHSNHPLVNSRLKPEFSGNINDELADLHAFNSAFRLKQAQEMMEQSNCRDIEQLKNIYKTEPVCVKGELGETVASVIFELGEKPVLHIAPGLPDKTAYQRVCLDD